MPQGRSSGGSRGCCCCLRRIVGDDAEETGGIPKPRGCTDIVWLVFYVMFCCVLVLLASFALVYGNPKRLTNGMDSFGNICGSVNEDFIGTNFSGTDMSDKPFVFYFDLSDMDSSTKICVNSCPTATIKDMNDLKEFYNETTINLCRYDFNLTDYNEDLDGIEANDLLSKFTLFDLQICPKFPIHSSHPVLKRCIPVLSASAKASRLDFSSIYDYLNGLNIFKQILGDLAVTWKTVLLLTFASFVISLILVLILHWMTTFMTYVILIGASLLSIGFTGFLWWTFIDIRNTVNGTENGMQLEEVAKNGRAFLVYSILATVFTVMLLLVILYVRRRVEIVVKLFRETGAVMMSMKCLLLQPFITYIALIVFFCAWLYIVLCLATSDYPSTRKIPSIAGLNDSSVIFTTESPLEQEVSVLSDSPRVNSTVNFEQFTRWTLIEFNDGVWVKYMWWLYLFGLIWCSEFILACQQMVIASSVSTWYFSRNRANFRCTVLKSITRMIQFHIGSVALGSLIITVVKLPRLGLQFLQQLVRKYSDFKPVMWLRKCCVCCLYCFDKRMKNVHHNAYTVISVQGTDFYPSSKVAFLSLVKDALQISIINSIGDFVLFLAKCIATAVTGLIALIMFRSDDTLYFYAIPVLLTIVFSYFVAHCVFSVFEMAMDTLFLCFCEDYHMNDGSKGKELYAPVSLLQYMTIDAVNAVAPQRRSQVNSPFHTKPAITADLIGATADEIIPMNPYGETTTTSTD